MLLAGEIEATPLVYGFKERFALPFFLYYCLYRAK
jgi:hypothetical protein